MRKFRHDDHDEVDFDFTPEVEPAPIDEFTSLRLRKAWWAANGEFYPEARFEDLTVTPGGRVLIGGSDDLDEVLDALEDFGAGYGDDPEVTAALRGISTVPLSLVPEKHLDPKRYAEVRGQRYLKPVR